MVETYLAACLNLWNHIRISPVPKGRKRRGGAEKGGTRHKVATATQLLTGVVGDASGAPSVWKLTRP